MNNRKNAGKVNLFFSILLLLVLIILGTSFLWDIGLERTLQISLVVLFLIIAFTYYSGGFYYFELESDNSGFRIKHYKLFPFGKQYKVYQIPLERYSHYTIKKLAGGLFSWLYLYERTNRGLAKYPSIGISALSPSQLKVLIDYLESIKIKL